MNALVLLPASSPNPALPSAAVHSREVLAVLLRHLGHVYGGAPPAGADGPREEEEDDPLSVEDVGGQSLLHYAASSNNAGSLELLLPLFSRRSGVDLLDAQGRTPLLCAAASDAAEAAQVLLRRGAAPQLCTPNGWSPFHHAAMHDYPAMLRLLYDHTFSTAAGKQRRRALEVLDAADALGCTPLHVAAEYGSAAAIQELLQLGSSVVKRDAGGRTPLHV